jgi:fatty acid desaturase
MKILCCRRSVHEISHFNLAVGFLINSPMFANWTALIAIPILDVVFALKVSPQEAQQRYSTIDLSLTALSSLLFVFANLYNIVMRNPADFWLYTLSGGIYLGNICMIIFHEALHQSPESLPHKISTLAMYFIGHSPVFQHDHKYGHHKNYSLPGIDCFGDFRSTVVTIY